MHRALKRLASRGNGRWRGMATAAKESMEGEKVYYSQSGCWMTVPGTAGLRVMELSLAGLTSPDPSLARALASTGVSTVLLPPIDAPLAAHTSALAKSIKQGGSVAAASLEATPNGSRELRALDAMLDAGVSEAVVHVPLRAPLDGGEVLKAVGLVEAAADRGLFVRAVLTEAFQAAPKHPDENACQAEMEEMVTRLADAGAGMACSVITLSDDRREATEDSLRDALEVCFGVDCRGEGMMERLSLRLADSAFCSAAVQLSVTRFEGSAAGSPRLTRTADLLAAAEAAGLRHGVDLAALERAAAALRDETKGR